MKLFSLYASLMFIGVNNISPAYAVNAGSYNSMPQRNMELSAANKWYRYEFIVPDDSPKGAVVTDVYYQYSLGQINVGGRGILEVMLCYGNESNCVNISSEQSGMTKAFQGESVDTPFIIFYGVKSNNTVGHISGNGTTQITVNWAVNK